MQPEFLSQEIAVGTKEVLRALRQEKAAKVYLANDCDERVAKPILAACETAQVPISREYTRSELGAACKLQVKAAAVVIMKESR